MLPSLLLVGVLATIILHPIFYFIRNCFDLGSAARFTNYKKICCRFRNFSQVQTNYLIALFILNCPQNGFKNFGLAGEAVVVVFLAAL